MKLKLNSFTDDLKFKIVHGYMNTDVSQKDGGDRRGEAAKRRMGDGKVQYATK